MPDGKRCDEVRAAVQRFARPENVRWVSIDLLTDDLCLSPVPELRTLRQPLKTWRSAILNYWTSLQTNARVEGFNNKAKLVKRRAYGYISIYNYRLRLPNACG